MLVEINVNGQTIKARKGDFLLNVLSQNGIRIPTLCSMEGFLPTGACRLCVVEVEGKADLVPACSYPVEESMKVKTHSAKVIQARRTIVELLISNHPDDCLYCFQTSHCELHRLASELKVTERKIRPKSIGFKSDRSSQALIHDPTKCVLCARCIRVCDELRVSALEFIGRGSQLRVGTAGHKGIEQSSCIYCGQCIQACPTGSLSEKSQMEELIQRLQEKKSEVIGLIDPAVMVSIGEELGFRPGKDLSGELLSALRKIGFDEVHTGSEMVDVSLFMVASEWMKRGEQDKGPSILSYCSAWMKYLEKLRPDLLKYILPVHSPPQLFGRLIRKKYPDAFIVYLSPCIGTKAERHDPENMKEGKPYLDAVLSTKELVQLVGLYGIDFERISAEVPDNLLNGVHLSGLLSAVSGGYMEALTRALWVLDSGRFPLQPKISRFRGTKLCKANQMSDFQPAQRWTACSSLATAIDLIDRAIGSDQPELFEIMACQGGCLNGGGQPGLKNEKTTRSRIREIYDADSEMSGQISVFANRALEAVKGLEPRSFNNLKAEEHGFY